MPQVPRLFQPRVEADDALAEEYEYQHMLLRQQDGPTPRCIFAEDTNLGDEAFVWLREDPEYLALIAR